MNRNVIVLARQILRNVPQADVNELIDLLNYYNKKFSEADRVRAMNGGSDIKEPYGIQLEAEVREQLVQIARGSLMAKSYISADKDVCRLCGK